MKALDTWCDNIGMWFICALGISALVWLIAGWDTLPLGAKGGLCGNHHQRECKRAQQPKR